MSKSHTTVDSKNHVSNALVIGFHEGRTWADKGTLLIVLFKVLYFSPLVGDFFLAKSLVF